MGDSKPVNHLNSHDINYQSHKDKHGLRVVVTVSNHIGKVLSYGVSGYLGSEKNKEKEALDDALSLLA